jgi:hypothetical protein
LWVRSTARHLGHDRDSLAEGDQRLNRRDLRAPANNLWLTLVSAAKAEHLLAKVRISLMARSAIQINNSGVRSQVRESGSLEPQNSWCEVSLSSLLSAWRG